MTPSPLAVVLRRPAGGGEFEFRIAHVEQPQADQLQRLASAGRLDVMHIEAFGPQMSLTEAMKRIKSRNFIVIDLSAAT